MLLETRDWGILQITNWVVFKIIIYKLLITFYFFIGLAPTEEKVKAFVSGGLPKKRCW